MVLIDKRTGRNKRDNKFKKNEKIIAKKKQMLIAPVFFNRI